MRPILPETVGYELINILIGREILCRNAACLSRVMGLIDMLAINDKGKLHKNECYGNKQKEMQGGFDAQS